MGTRLTLTMSVVMRGTRRSANTTLGIAHVRVRRGLAHYSYTWSRYLDAGDCTKPTPRPATYDDLGVHSVDARPLLRHG